MTLTERIARRNAEPAQAHAERKRIHRVRQRRSGARRTSALVELRAVVRGF